MDWFLYRPFQNVPTVWQDVFICNPASYLGLKAVDVDIRWGAARSFTHTKKSVSTQVVLSTVVRKLSNVDLVEVHRKVHEELGDSSLSLTVTKNNWLSNGCQLVACWPGWGFLRSRVLRWVSAVQNIWIPLRLLVALLFSSWHPYRLSSEVMLAVATVVLFVFSLITFLSTRSLSTVSNFYILLFLHYPLTLSRAHLTPVVISVLLVSLSPPPSGLWISAIFHLQFFPHDRPISISPISS